MKIQKRSESNVLSKLPFKTVESRGYANDGTQQLHEVTLDESEERPDTSRVISFVFYSFSLALILQIIWVMVPMGQKLHQALGFHRVFTTRPMMVEVSIRL